VCKKKTPGGVVQGCSPPSGEVFFFWRGKFSPPKGGGTPPPFWGKKGGSNNTKGVGMIFGHKSPGWEEKRLFPPQASGVPGPPPPRVLGKKLTPGNFPGRI